MTRHRSLGASVLALAIAVAGLVPAPSVLADSDPVAERASITYRLDRARQRIEASGSFRFTNRIPVQRVGNRVRRIYLERWGPIAISADATNLRVRPRSVKVQRIPTGGPFDNLVFSFPRIFNGQSVSFTATWRVPGRAGASTTGTFVSDPYSHFCWTGQPVDTGPIALVVPRDLEVVNQGSAVREGRTGNQRRLTARGRDLATFYVCTDVYDPSLLVRRDLTSPRGHAVTVEGLPGHDAWLDATSTSIAEALAGVEAVVGAPLPGDEPIKVREVPSGALQGYAGDFDPRSGVVRVGDDGASVALLSHELSHAWFNGDTLNDNWLWEGLAEWASRETIGVPCDAPVERPFGGRPDLGDWKLLQAGSASFEDQAMVQWQYQAACAIQGQVSMAIGRDRMQQAIAVLLAGDSPYDLLPTSGTGDTPTSDPASTDGPSASPEPRHLPPGGLPPGPPSPSPAASDAPTPALTSATRSSKRRTKPVDWRQWLDIVDEVGLVPAGVADLTFAEDLLVETGVIRRRAVRGRADARAAYRDLQALAPAGVTPVVVRRALDGWDFEVATREMRLARQVAGRVSAAVAASPEMASLWADYEAASSRGALRRLRDRLP